MDLDGGVAIAGFVVGVVVGLTGMGGGALMTPILVLGFGIQPLAAVSNDLVAAVVMKPIGGGIHFRRGTVHSGLVRWLVLGSVPGAFGGAFLVSHLGDGVTDWLRALLGATLLVAAAGMIARAVLAHRSRAGTTPSDLLAVRRLPTVVIGLCGGLIVGMTSVGSGSLMIVSLLFLYPSLTSRELVGTDLVQAVPLVFAAALGHLIWGDLQLSLTTSLLLGSVPGVILGARVSSRSPDAVIRPILILVLTLSALKLLEVSDLATAFTGIGLALLMVGIALQRRTVRRRARLPDTNGP